MTKRLTTKNKITGQAEISLDVNKTDFNLIQDLIDIVAKYEDAAEIFTARLAQLEDMFDTEQYASEIATLRWVLSYMQYVRNIQKL